MTKYQELSTDFCTVYASLRNLKLKDLSDVPNLTDNEKAALKAANDAVIAVRGQILNILNKKANPNNIGFSSLTEYDQTALASRMTAVVNAYLAVVNPDNENPEANAKAAAEAIENLEKHADSACGSRAIRVLGTAMKGLSLALMAVAVVSLGLGVISAFTGVLALPASLFFMVALSSFSSSCLVSLLTTYSLSYLDPVGKSMDKLGSALNKLKPKQLEAENTSCGGKFAKLFFAPATAAKKEAKFLRQMVL